MAGWFRRKRERTKEEGQSRSGAPSGLRAAEPATSTSAPLDSPSAHEPGERPLPPVDQEVIPFVRARLDQLVGMARNALDRRILEQLRQAVEEESLEIPMVPDVAGQLLSLQSDGDLSNLEVAGLIGRDQALSAQVLQIANSPAMGGNHVQDLDRCVSVLGFEMIRAVAVGVAMSDAVYRVPGYEEEARELRFHSEQVAAQAAMMARCCKGESAGDLYMAGLFHDVGKLVVYLNLSRLRAHTRGGRPTTLLVRKLVDELHPVLGTTFAEMRDLPEMLRWTIGYHHAPGLTPGRVQTGVALVALADLLDEEPDALDAFEDGSHPLLLDPTFWPEDLPDLSTVLDAWKASA